MRTNNKKKQGTRLSDLVNDINFQRFVQVNYGNNDFTNTAYQLAYKGFKPTK